MSSLVLYRRTDGLLEPGDDETLAYVKRLSPAQKLTVKAPNTETGSVPMLRTWRKWMEETAQFMHWQGCRMPLYVDRHGNPQGQRGFRADDAHELFTSKWLGVDENGKRYSWAMRTRDPEVTVAPKSRRLYAMDRHCAWAAEREIKLTIPRDSEYMRLREDQER